ncbi:MAG: hypothetical protein V4646_08910 [Pseudomonadota bacterium]
MKHLLEPLENCTEISELRPALHLLCDRFGSIARLDILPASHVGRRQALCFLRMASAEQEETLVRELGIGRFGGALVLVVDLLPRANAGTAAVLSMPSISPAHEQQGVG